MKIRAEVYKRRDNLWEWRLVASNGEIVATSGSQGYTERNDCVEGYKRVVAMLRQAALSEVDNGSLERTPSVDE